ncbi:MAG TPA: DUF302 domain-containing protein [bacterium]|nr:DUF302 domain-containing protein [bacterium]
MTKKRSNNSVVDTVNKLKGILREKDIQIFSEVDHKANAQSVDMELNDSVAITFGNPTIGTKILQKNILVSLDLPIRIAVVQTNEKKVWVIYKSIPELVKEYNLETNEALEKTDNLLESITDKITQ